MKRILGSVAVLGLILGVGVVKAADEAQTVKGVIVDAKCGKGKNEEAAAKHPTACAIKCATGGEKIVVITGDKTYTLDDKGQTLAKDYLEKNKDKAGATKVQIMGTLAGDQLKVTEIKAQDAKG